MYDEIFVLEFANLVKGNRNPITPEDLTSFSKMKEGEQESDEKYWSQVVQGDQVTLTRRKGDKVAPSITLLVKHVEINLDRSIDVFFSEGGASISIPFAAYKTTEYADPNLPQYFYNIVD